MALQQRRLLRLDQQLWRQGPEAANGLGSVIASQPGEQDRIGAEHRAIGGHCLERQPRRGRLEAGMVGDGTVAAGQHVGDGLGLPLQAGAELAGGLGRDLLAHRHDDQHGRQTDHQQQRGEDQAAQRQIRPQGAI